MNILSSNKMAKIMIKIVVFAISISGIALILTGKIPPGLIRLASGIIYIVVSLIFEAKIKALEEEFKPEEEIEITQEEKYSQEKEMALQKSYIEKDFFRFNLFWIVIINVIVFIERLL